MRVVGGRGVGHGAHAARVQVAQVVRELLHLVVRDLAVVAHRVVARRTGRALYGLVGHLRDEFTELHCSYIKSASR